MFEKRAEKNRKEPKRAEKSRKEPKRTEKNRKTDNHKYFPFPDEEANYSKVNHSNNNRY